MQNPSRSSVGDPSSLVADLCPCSSETDNEHTSGSSNLSSPSPTHADTPCDQPPQGVDGPGGGGADAGLRQRLGGGLGVPGAPWHLRGAVATEGAHFSRSPVAAGHRRVPGHRALSDAGAILIGAVVADCLGSGVAPAAAGWCHRYQSAGCVPACRQ